MTMNDTPVTTPTTDEAHSLQGAVLECSSAPDVDAVIAKAVDYRGDVTLVLLDGSTIVGYLFDRRPQDNPPIARMWPKDMDQQFVVPYSQIAKIIFDGKDAAAGKSWENWIKKHAEKTAKGEKAEMLPDALDDE
jgi:hypothetical protein